MRWCGGCTAWLSESPLSLIATTRIKSVAVVYYLLNLATTVVSSGIQFIFIMSYGIYSVDKCLISVLYDCSDHYILNTCSL